jgi:hypothetical protein
MPGLPEAIQKLRPSLQAPQGNVPDPMEKVPNGDRSAAFHTETLGWGTWFVTKIRRPSKAAPYGLLSPLPLRVATTEPLAVCTTATVLEPLTGTQMFTPSKTGKNG